MADVVGEVTSLNGTATIYTVPSGTIANIHAAVAGNSDASDQTLTSVTIGGVAYINSKIISPQGTILNAIEGQFLTAGTVVAATATGSFISVRLSIEERTL